MSFIGTLIICFWAGWINSYLYSYHLKKKHRGALFWCAFLFLSTLIIFDFLIFYDLFDVHIFSLIFPWIHFPKGLAAGRYWLFTPGLLLGNPLEIPVENYQGLVWEVFAFINYISYIFWFIIGQNLGRFMYGRRTYEKGAWYLLRSTKMIQRSKKKLEKRKKKQTRKTD
ncbi:MAG: hypothetical protein ACOC4M_09735 [Promethearchaeia archaeon]